MPTLVTDIEGFLRNVACQEIGGIVAKKKKVKKRFSGCHEADNNLLSSPDKVNMNEVAALVDNLFVSNVFWEELGAAVLNLHPTRIIEIRRGLQMRCVRVSCQKKKWHS